MIAQSIGRLGNFVNQEAWKSSCHLNYVPEFIRQQMFIDGSYRVPPTFLYESLWNLVGFITILGLRRFNKKLRQGDVTSFYLIWYGLGRFVIEGMRTDSSSYVCWLACFSMGVSIAIIILGAILLYLRKQRPEADYKMKN